MTMAAQSVSAMMPYRMSVTSGLSSAYAPPTHPPGIPLMSAAAVETPAALIKVRRVVRFMSSLREEHVGPHYIRLAVRSARCGLLQECSGEDVRVSRGDLKLRRERLGDLQV